MVPGASGSRHGFPGRPYAAVSMNARRIWTERFQIRSRAGAAFFLHPRSRTGTGSSIPEATALCLRAGRYLRCPGPDRGRVPGAPEPLEQAVFQVAAAHLAQIQHQNAGIAVGKGGGKVVAHIFQMGVHRSFLNAPEGQAVSGRRYGSSPQIGKYSSATSPASRTSASR